jgi:plastocyanin
MAGRLSGRTDHMPGQPENHPPAAPEAHVPAAPVQHGAPIQHAPVQHNAPVVVPQKGHQVVTETTVVIIWVNNGGGAPTSKVHETMMPEKKTHVVKVGGPAGLVYDPEEIKANVGDMIVFEFLAKNHTVTQSPFDTPCKKLEGGMDSGFIANADNAIIPAPQMAMQVTTDKPLWFYCRQATHCGKGMVFSVNAPADKTHAQFKQKAIEQNGTGAVPPIAGGDPAAAPPADAPPAAAPPADAPPAGSPPAAAPPAASTVAPPPGMATGIGSVGGDGSCSCSCLCGAASFPNAGLQGRGHWGGMSGAIPMAALEK